MNGIERELEASLVFATADQGKRLRAPQKIFQEKYQRTVQINRCTLPPTPDAPTRNTSC